MDIEWQPIETVPADKRVQLGMFLANGYWCQEVGWITDAGWCVAPGDANFQLQNPTHWHELLPPPEKD